MSPEQLLTHLTNQQNILKSDIRQMIMDSNIMIHAKIIDEVENLEGKIDQVIQHGKEQNGKVFKNVERLIEFDRELLLLSRYPETCTANKVTKYWKSTLFLSVSLIIVVNWLLNTYTWFDIIELLKRIV